MKEFLVKQAFKMLFAVVLFPIGRWVLMPMVLSKVTEPGQPPHLSGGPAAPAQTVSLSSVPAAAYRGPVAEYAARSADTQRTFDEVARLLQQPVGQPALKSNRQTTQVPVARHSTTSTPPTKTPDRQARVSEVNGHRILISPSADSSNSVILQPSKSAKPGSTTKCPPGRT